MQEYESIKTSPEELAETQREILEDTTKIMSKYYEGILNAEISEADAEKKDTEVAKFIGSLSAVDANFNPSEYRLYYVLTNQEPEVGVEYKFDIPGDFGPLSKGLIEAFIEKTFKIKK